MLTLEEKIGQKLLIGFDGLQVPDYVLEWLAAGRIGGVYFFSRNIDTPQQVANMARACHEAAKNPILIGIDQEGGVVARLRDGFTESPGAMALAAAGSETLAEDVSVMLAAEMRALGINWVFAPVLDVTHDFDNPSVGTRSLSTDKDVVARFSAAQVRGFQKMGVAACAKHFPGLGNTPVDTHDALAVIDGPLDYLWENDLVPFRYVVQMGVDTIMTTHVKFTALDAEHPTTLSPITLKRLLREEIGFDGVVSTDCMEMKAITDEYTPGESAVLAALADVDLILFSHTRAYQEAASEALLNAVHTGRIPLAMIDKSVARIQRLKAKYSLDRPTSSLEVIRSEAHLTLAHQAARAGTVLLKSDPSVFPLNFDKHKIALVEFASYLDSGVIEEGGKTNFVSILQSVVPDIDTVSLRSFGTNDNNLQLGYTLAEASDVLVLATRNAHLIPSQLEMARSLIARAKQVILLCLRNPYDVLALDGVGTVICTCGDSTPSLQAAVDALLGRFTPSGKLPVDMGWS